MLPRGDNCISGLKEPRSLPLSTFTPKVCHTFKVSNSNVGLCCCPRNNCINAEGTSGFVPTSPELCWNICYLKHQPGPVAVFCVKGYVWTNNFDSILILFKFSQILSLWQQVITWHSLAQHNVVSNVKVKQYNLAALTSGINISRVLHFSCQSGKLIDH